MKNWTQLKHLIFLFLLILIGATVVNNAFAKGEAKQLFSEKKKLVYQVRIIDIASGDKSSIGSGFQVSENGLIATNYHVVSEYVHEPKKHRLEVVDHAGNTTKPKLLDIDVIHDIAILKIDVVENDFFRIRSEPLAKGQRIYSIGNPQDLGMTIIEGNYNGHIEKSRHERLLFSGSLNPGMSGGPTIDGNGMVVGVNVSKGGEQISFLVPAKWLEKQLSGITENSPQKPFDEIIQQALYQDQDQYYKKLLDNLPDSEPFGELMLPGQLATSLKCWGHTVDTPKILYESFHKHCKTEDILYIDSNFKTGSFAYNYEWLSTDKLNKTQFYHAADQRFEHVDLYNLYKEKYATNYECHTGFINIDGSSWKVSTCFRQYKQYEGLYDALLLLGSADRDHQAAIITAAATGISNTNAIALFKMFMESIKWKN